MSSSTSLPSDDDTMAFFASNRSYTRFKQFVDTFLLNHKVTWAACDVLVRAVALVEASTLPPPLDGFVKGYTDMYGSLKIRAGFRSVDMAAFGGAVGLPANSDVLFSNLLPVNAAGLLVEEGAQMLAGLLAQVLAHCNYSALKRRGVICEQCASEQALLGDCRLVADNLAEDADTGDGICCSCFAQGRKCTWPETPDDFEA